MSDIAIKVEGLSKRYKIGKLQRRHDTLRDRIADVRLFNHFKRHKGNSHNGYGVGSDAKSPQLPIPASDILWALKDVSFEVKRGEVVGIIGRNGAGKSTLLKILSRITEPTEGYADINGRVASLLEVGTGFHPELTGRDNIYLNGSILGMKRSEINNKFDEIVAFAEIEKFIDTPVKRYSSGMYVRLAFAVAAHLDPEILLVDEVLSVGDAAFQKKCLGKIGDVAREGRTVVLVSHNMNAIQRLCQKAVLLDEGLKVFEGGATQGVNAYLDSSPAKLSGFADLTDRSVRRTGSGLARIVSVELLTLAGRRSAEFKFSEPMRVRMTIQSQAQIANAIFGFSFVSRDGVELQGTVAHDGGISCDLKPGLQVMECRVEPMILTPGLYRLRGAVFRAGVSYDHIDEIAEFHVVPIAADLSSIPLTHYVGHVYLPYKWSRPGIHEFEIPASHRLYSRT